MLKSFLRNSKKFSFSKIYTKVGDKGNSSIIDGKSQSKSNKVFHCLGTIDELNSNIGLALEFSKQNEELIDIKTELEILQPMIFHLSTIIAYPEIKQKMREDLVMTEKEITTLEEKIDEITNNKLEPLNNFILPSGSLTNAQLNVCRSICRRAERHLVELVSSGERGDSLDDVLKFFNRLSDFLFTLARYSLALEDEKEVIV